MLILFLLAPLQSAEAKPSKGIHIGVIIPLSGPTATYGIDCLAGINLAVERINESGGVKGELLVLEVRDNQGDPLRTAQEVKSLVDEGALAIIGAVTSNNTIAAGTVAQSEGIPLLTPYATHAAVTEVGDYISRICFTDLQQASVMASYAYGALGMRRMAVLSEHGSRYSESLAEYIETEFRQLGGEIVMARSFRSLSTEVPKYLKQFKSLAPDAIFIPVYYAEAAVIAKEAARFEVCNNLLGGDGWESRMFFDLVGDTLSSLQIHITSHFSIEDSRPVVRRFVDDFNRTNNRMPTALSALAYDAGLVLAEALARSPQVNRSALKEAINSTDNFEGVTGSISLNEKRDPRKGTYILHVQDNGFHLRVAGMKSN
jgi:branched-chain amino acid transport system substrate-binding protein